MKDNNNVFLKEYAAQKKAAYWKIGEKLNLSENTIYRWLRMPLPEEKFTKIKNAIDEVAAE